MNAQPSQSSTSPSPSLVDALCDEREINVMPDLSALSEKIATEFGVKSSVVTIKPDVLNKTFTVTFALEVPMYKNEAQA